MPATPSAVNEEGLHVLQPGGLNERTRFSGNNDNGWDCLVGFIQGVAGKPQRVNGIRRMLSIPGKKILNFCQTFDDRQNVLVQTDQGVYRMSEAEFFGHPIPTNLTPVVLPEEEDMARALIYHTEPSGTNGGTLPSAIWSTAPLNQLIEQVNPDGSAASFVTALAANIFTLAAGTYRFKIRCLQSDNSSACIGKARLYNVTTGLPAWNGLQNEESTSGQGAQDRNMVMFIEGSLTIAVPTQFRVEQWSSSVANNTGFGAPVSSGKPEVYRQVEILKTA